MSRGPILVCVAERLDATVRTRLQTHFDGVFELPIQEKLLFNALHTVTAREQDQRVTVISDWLARKAKGGRRKLTILVADDQPTNRLLVAKILERAGHSVVEAEDGQAALDAMERTEVDIAILDRNMPELDGIAATRAIRVMEHRGRHLPIIILTADVTEDARQAAADAGADITLPKPVQPIRLLECVSSLCDQATPQEPEPVVSEASQRPSTRELAALLNAETVKQLATLGNGHEFLSRLATTFEAENRKLLDQVEAAVRAKHFVEIPSILHALKGSAGSLGLDHLAHICGQYQSLRDGELRFKGDELARQLRTAFNEGCAALQGHIETLRIQDSARGSS